MDRWIKDKFKGIVRDSSLRNNISYSVQHMMYNYYPREILIVVIFKQRFLIFQSLYTYL